MSSLASVLSLQRGARFYRADLHVHSYGASHDVKDAGMTPAAIVDKALTEGLGLLAITDHNEVKNVAAAIAHANGRDLLVVPGVELSTSQGHLLCYLPTADALQRLFGQLDIAGQGTADSRCRTGLHQCLDLVDRLGGFAVLAHVDGPGGFEEAEPTNSPHKIDIIAHRALLGVELKTATSTVSYAPGDSSADRAAAGATRIERLQLGAQQHLARVLNSDAHSLLALGRNAAGDKRVTRIKMDTPGFEALRLAFEDADARIRIEEEIPSSVPSVLGVAFDGGFLDGQAIHFSPNLNCIIGGRGTGKSTTFESVRCLSAEPASGSPLLDSDIWPDGLHLFWQDAAGQRHSLFRQRDGGLSNADNPFSGPTEFEVDSFGQGETAKISAQVNSNPLALLNYLDRFIRVADAIKEEDAARESLLSLQSQIEKAEQQVQLIPQYEKALQITRQQLAALKTAKAEEIIELKRQVAEERAFREQIKEQFDSVSETLSAELGIGIGQHIRDLLAESTLKLATTSCDAILAAVDEFEAAATASAEQLREKFKRLNATTDSHIQTWKAAESDILQQIEAKRKELEQQGLRLDMSYIEKLTKDEASQQKTLVNLKTWVPHLAKLVKERAEVLKDRWSARNTVSTRRVAYAAHASNILDRELVNPKVSLKFVADAFSPAASELIIKEMGWRTVQVPRAAVLIEQLTVPKLLQAVEKMDKSAITTLTVNGVKIFDSQEAQLIIERLSVPHVRYALERCEIHDLPKLIVTKKIEEGGKPRYVPRDFGKLSLGQQQSVLLALMLCSSGNHPLIIDQPEDNLDGEFIYSTLVPVLRRAKERRQVIVVTHNANIAVLGDAELIVILKSGNEKGTVVGRGSIDHPNTRDEACRVLEGATEAFKRRAKTYGLRLA